MKEYTLEFEQKYIERIQKGSKIHTIRRDLKKWQKIATEVNTTDTVLHLISNKDPWVKIKTLDSIRIDSIVMFNSKSIYLDRSNIFLFGKRPSNSRIQAKIIDIEEFAKNDGTTVRKCLDYLEKYSEGGKDIPLIYLTDFRY